MIEWLVYYASKIMHGLEESGVKLEVSIHIW
jgi:hypothetical protein